MDKKIVIAHRSASGYLPEHSLPALAMAHAFGVDFVEPDIVLTKDDQAIVLHDIYLDTTTNVKEIYPGRTREDGRFYAIDFTLKEIKNLLLTERFDLENSKEVYPERFPSWRSSFQIPSFKEYIELVQGLNHSRKGNLGICTEIKACAFHTENGKDIVKITFELLCRYGFNVENSLGLIESFDHSAIKRLKEEFGCKIPLGLLVGYNSWHETQIDYEHFLTYDELKRNSHFCDFIAVYLGHLFYKDDDDKLRASFVVEMAHNLGLKVFAYTHRKDDLTIILPNNDIHSFESNEQLLEALFECANIDGLFSDFGDLVLDYLNQRPNFVADLK